MQATGDCLHHYRKSTVEAETRELFTTENTEITEEIGEREPDSLQQKGIYHSGRDTVKKRFKPSAISMFSVVNN